MKKMKRFLSLLMVVSVLVSAMAVTAAAVDQGSTMTVYGTTYFLGLRSAPAYDGSNIIAQLHNGDTVTVLSTGYGANGVYCYVQSSKGQGYVDSRYLKSGSSSYSCYTQGTTKQVYGTTYFLGLRSAPAYDDRNIIAQLHNGDTVTVLSYGYGTNGVYCYVQSSKGQGYVDSRYLQTPGSSYYCCTQGTTKTVYGTTYYMGLRSAPAYDERNIIAKLHNGDTVTVLSYGYGTNGVYCYVQSAKGQGYVDSRYLR